LIAAVFKFGPPWRCTGLAGAFFFVCAQAWLLVNLNAGEIMKHPDNTTNEDADKMPFLSNAFIFTPSSNETTYFSLTSYFWRKIPKDEV
jgi:hypothetical protein